METIIKLFDYEVAKTCFETMALANFHGFNLTLSTGMMTASFDMGLLFDFYFSD